MRDVLWAHTTTLLRFFARHRVLLVFAIIMVGIWMIGFIPYLSYQSTGQRFNVLRTIASQLHGLAWFGGAGLGLLAMSSHMRNGTTRVIFTRPAAPELWVAAVFLSSFFIALVVHVAAEAVTVALSLAWGVPYQFGFLYATIDAMLESMIVISMLTALASLVHPVIAALAALLSHDTVWYQFRLMIESEVQANGASWWTVMFGWPVKIVYAVTPMLDPFAREMGLVTESMRVLPTDWAYLVASLGYTSVAVVFFFCVSALAVRRKSLP
jgi:hypothetical protein